MELVEIEIARHDWASMVCGCGRSGAHLADDLPHLVSAKTAAEVHNRRLDRHLHNVGLLMEPAPAVVSVFLAALADEAAPAVRDHVVETISDLVLGEGTSNEVRDTSRDLVEECRAAARPGIWIIYREVFHGADEDTKDHAFHAIARVDDLDRAQRVQAALGNRLHPALRAGKYNLNTPG